MKPSVVISLCRNLNEAFWLQLMGFHRTLEQAAAFSPFRPPPPPPKEEKKKTERSTLVPCGFCFWVLLFPQRLLGFVSIVLVNNL